jgi:hypothetical protein
MGSLRLPSSPSALLLLHLLSLLVLLVPALPAASPEWAWPMEHGTAANNAYVPAAAGPLGPSGQGTVRAVCGVPLLPTLTSSQQQADVRRRTSSPEPPPLQPPPPHTLSGAVSDGSFVYIGSAGAGEGSGVLCFDLSSQQGRIAPAAALSSHTRLPLVSAQSDDATVVHAPAIAPGTGKGRLNATSVVLVSSTDGTLTASALAGCSLLRILWSLSLGAPVLTAPRVDATGAIAVVIISGSPSAVGIDVTTGTVLWRWNASVQSPDGGVENDDDPAPAIVSNEVYIAFRGTVVRLNLLTGAQELEAEVGGCSAGGPCHVSMQGGCVLDSLGDTIAVTGLNRTTGKGFLEYFALRGKAGARILKFAGEAEIPGALSDRGPAVPAFWEVGSDKFVLTASAGANVSTLCLWLIPLPAPNSCMVLAFDIAPPNVTRAGRRGEEEEESGGRRTSPTDPSPPSRLVFAPEHTAPAIDGAHNVWLVGTDAATGDVLLLIVTVNVPGYTFRLPPVYVGPAISDGRNSSSPSPGSILTRPLLLPSATSAGDMVVVFGTAAGPTLLSNFSLAVPCPTASDRPGVWCSGNGVCACMTGECACGMGWTGPDCASPAPSPSPSSSPSSSASPSSSPVARSPSATCSDSASAASRGSDETLSTALGAAGGTVAVLAAAVGAALLVWRARGKGGSLQGLGRAPVRWPLVLSPHSSPSSATSISLARTPEWRAALDAGMERAAGLRGTAHETVSLLGSASTRAGQGGSVTTEARLSMLARAKGGE